MYPWLSYYYKLSLITYFQTNTKNLKDYIKKKNNQIKSLKEYDSCLSGKHDVKLERFLKRKSEVKNLEESNKNNLNNQTKTCDINKKETYLSEVKMFINKIISENKKKALDKKSISESISQYLKKEDKQMIVKNNQEDNYLIQKNIPEGIGEIVDDINLQREKDHNIKTSLEKKFAINPTDNKIIDMNIPSSTLNIDLSKSSFDDKKSQFDKKLHNQLNNSDLNRNLTENLNHSLAKNIINSKLITNPEDETIREGSNYLIDKLGVEGKINNITVMFKDPIEKIKEDKSAALIENSKMTQEKHNLENFDDKIQENIIKDKLIGVTDSIFYKPKNMSHQISDVEKSIQKDKTYDNSTREIKDKNNPDYPNKYENHNNTIKSLNVIEAKYNKTSEKMISTKLELYPDLKHEEKSKDTKRDSKDVLPIKSTVDVNSFNKSTEKLNSQENLHTTSRNQQNDKSNQKFNSNIKEKSFYNPNDEYGNKPVETSHGIYNSNLIGKPIEINNSNYNSTNFKSPTKLADMTNSQQIIPDKHYSNSAEKLNDKYKNNLKNQLTFYNESKQLSDPKLVSKSSNILDNEQITGTRDKMDLIPTVTKINKENAKLFEKPSNKSNTYFHMIKTVKPIDNLNQISMIKPSQESEEKSSIKPNEKNLSIENLKNTIEPSKTINQIIIPLNFNKTTNFKPPEREKSPMKSEMKTSNSPVLEQNITETDESNKNRNHLISTIQNDKLFEKTLMLSESSFYKNNIKSIIKPINNSILKLTDNSTDLIESIPIDYKSKKSSEQISYEKPTNNSFNYSNEKSKDENFNGKLQDIYNLTSSSEKTIAKSIENINILKNFLNSSNNKKVEKFNNSNQESDVDFKENLKNNSTVQNRELKYPNNTFSIDKPNYIPIMKSINISINQLDEKSIAKSYDKSELKASDEADLNIIKNSTDIMDYKGKNDPKSIIISNDKLKSQSTNLNSTNKPFDNPDINSTVLINTSPNQKSTDKPNTSVNSKVINADKFRDKLELDLKEKLSQKLVSDIENQNIPKNMKDKANSDNKNTKTDQKSKENPINSDLTEKWTELSNYNKITNKSENTIDMSFNKFDKNSKGSTDPKSNDNLTKILQEKANDSNKKSIDDRDKISENESQKNSSKSNQKFDNSSSPKDKENANEKPYENSLNMSKEKKKENSSNKIVENFKNSEERENTKVSKNPEVKNKQNPSTNSQESNKKESKNESDVKFTGNSNSKNHEKSSNDKTILKLEDKSKEIIKDKTNSKSNLNTDANPVENNKKLGEASSENKLENKMSENTNPSSVIISGKPQENPISNLDIINEKAEGYSKSNIKENIQLEKTSNNTISDTYINPDTSPEIILSNENLDDITINSSKKQLNQNIPELKDINESSTKSQYSIDDAFKSSNNTNSMNYSNNSSIESLNKSNDNFKNNLESPQIYENNNKSINSKNYSKSENQNVLQTTYANNIEPITELKDSINSQNDSKKNNSPESSPNSKVNNFSDTNGDQKSINHIYSNLKKNSNNMHSNIHSTNIDNFNLDNIDTSTLNMDIGNPVINQDTAKPLLSEQINQDQSLLNDLEAIDIEELIKQIEINPSESYAITLTFNQLFYNKTRSELHTISDSILKKFKIKEEKLDRKYSLIKNKKSKGDPPQTAELKVDDVKTNYHAIYKEVSKIIESHIEATKKILATDLKQNYFAYYSKMLGYLEEISTQFKKEYPPSDKYSIEEYIKRFKLLKVFKVVEAQGFAMMEHTIKFSNTIFGLLDNLVISDLDNLYKNINLIQISDNSENFDESSFKLSLDRFVNYSNTNYENVNKIKAKIEEIKISSNYKLEFRFDILNKIIDKYENYLIWIKSDRESKHNYEESFRSFIETSESLKFQEYLDVYKIIYNDIYEKYVIIGNKILKAIKQFQRIMDIYNMNLLSKTKIEKQIKSNPQLNTQSGPKNLTHSNNNNNYQTESSFDIIYLILNVIYYIIVIILILIHYKCFKILLLQSLSFMMHFHYDEVSLFNVTITISSLLGSSIISYIIGHILFKELLIELILAINGLFIGAAIIFNGNVGILYGQPSFVFFGVFFAFGFSMGFSIVIRAVLIGIAGVLFYVLGDHFGKTILIPFKNKLEIRDERGRAVNEQLQQGQPQTLSTSQSQYLPQPYLQLQPQQPPARTSPLQIGDNLNNQTNNNLNYKL